VKEKNKMVFGFFKKDKVVPQNVTSAKESPKGFDKLKQSLAKTRQSFTAGIANIVVKNGAKSQEMLLELRKLLLDADVGASTTSEVLELVKQNISGKELKDSAALEAVLTEVLVEVLRPCDPPELFTREDCSGPLTILLIGVNGAGKTTTCGKLAHMFSCNNKKVLLAAGDTFRAAAISQLQVWGEKTNCQVVAQHYGADSASVIYDAFSSATAQKCDVMLADTAGRLQNKDNLIQELQKIKRVMSKIDASAPEHTWLVLDGSIGQNNLLQAKKFHADIGLTGIIVTKLDGSAKGGSIFAIAAELKLPIFFIGIGEALDDLQLFDSKAFVSELFHN
jgi:fused signal recognition particle receptor